MTHGGFGELDCTAVGVVREGGGDDLFGKGCRGGWLGRVDENEAMNGDVGGEELAGDFEGDDAADGPTCREIRRGKSRR